MEIRLLLALVGSAISFAALTFAQEKSAVDTQIIEQLATLGNKTDDAFNDGDAVALAALYTEDAVLVMDTGPIYGRGAAFLLSRADEFPSIQYWWTERQHSRGSITPLSRKLF